MRLLTHNMLACVKCQSFPLNIEATEVAPAEAAYDPMFLKRMLARVNYDYLHDAYKQLKVQCKDQLQLANMIPDKLEDIDFSNDHSQSMKDVHYALCAVAVKSGSLVCGACNCKFAINEFIPNMNVE